MSRPYLIPNRLEDVVFLIQFLGLREDFCLTAANKSVRKPRSAGTWAEVCASHPEFFENTPENSVYLSVRFYLGESRKREPIQLNDVQLLIKTAMEIHERQFKVFCDEEERKFKSDAEVHIRQQKKLENVRAWLTMMGAAIAGIASIANLFWHFSK